MVLLRVRLFLYILYIVFNSLLLVAVLVNTLTTLQPNKLQVYKCYFVFQASRIFGMYKCTRTVTLLNRSNRLPARGCGFDFCIFYQISVNRM